ncbi:hypothetical protein AYO49_00765 [Verrucomicrobiaceae bacterium SCGC AG-212-N21]|nr:hypothetical protein AYO49_00765 [Verrucomicrobiaceae bacterium SCGC AG-212-N21]
MISVLCITGRESQLMTRRQWLLLSAASLVGCGKDEAAARQVTIRAGSFTVEVPADWNLGAGVQQVPIKPVFSESQWTKYQGNPMFGLKPHYGNRPEHWAIRLPALRPPGTKVDYEEAGDDPVAPQILIHNASQWSRVYSDGKHESKLANMSVPALRKQMEDWIAKSETGASPAFMDASLSFICLRKQLHFRGGRGVRVLCQWTIESTLVQLGELHYMFLGMSDDDTCQIIATFPLNHPELPKQGPSASHLGWSMERYSQLSKDMDRYESEAIHWMVENEKKFTPSLSALDTMIESLSATKWE